MEKYKDKYRIPSARHPFWDYGSNAAYFVTLCTQNRECWFGDVVEGRMQLSPIGHIANSCWYEIPHHFPFVELASHVIMPNHVHGIVVINKRDDGSDNRPNIQRDDGYPDESNMETQNLASLQSKSPSQQPKNQFKPQSRNLASIMRGFKIGVTKNARHFNPDFQWQSRYHDHIIRDEHAFQKISAYMINNPINWQEDKFYRADK